MNATQRFAAFLLGGIVVTAVLAMLVSPFASSEPDGLERVAIDQGFIDTASAHATGDNPLADYGVRGVSDERVATGLAGLVGIVICFVAAAAIGLVLRRARRLDVHGADPGPGHAGHDPLAS